MSLREYMHRAGKAFRDAAAQINSREKLFWHHAQKVIAARVAIVGVLSPSAGDIAYGTYFGELATEDVVVKPYGSVALHGPNATPDSDPLASLLQDLSGTPLDVPEDTAAKAEAEANYWQARQTVGREIFWRLTDRIKRRASHRDELMDGMN